MRLKCWEMFVCVFTHSLADVLSCEGHVAGPTPEATDVPLFLQRQERLTLLDLVSTPSTVWRRIVCVEEKEKEEWEKREDEGSKHTEIRGIAVERKRQRETK